AQGIPLETADRHPETAQMMIMNPLSGGGRRGSFSTHPATQERVQRLLPLAGARGGGRGGGRAMPAPLARERDGAAQATDARAAGRDIAYTACRQLGRVRGLARLVNSRPPPPRLAALQWVALAQLGDPLRADAVVVDQAVASARLEPGAAAVAGFLNATLRR